MDNFTHSMAGWALGQAGLKTKTRKGLAALILGANMPDIDVFLGWVPWTPLATHRGFTHGIGGVVLLPPLLALLLWLLDRWQQGRGATFRSGLAMHAGWLVALCYLGTLTHPLLDLQTSYAVQLLAPFSTRWFHSETLFILDVWIWSALGFAIWLSRRREGRGLPWRRPAIVGLICTCVYVAINGGISIYSRHILLAQLAGTRPDVIIAGQQPVLFWRRDLIWRQSGLIGRASYDPLRAPGRLSDLAAPVPDNMTDPLVRRAAQSPAIASFLRWSILPMAQVATKGCTATVTFGDARFGVPARASWMARPVTLPDAAPGCDRS